MSQNTDPVMPNFTPVRIIEVELGQPLPDLSTLDPKTSQHYKRVMILAKLHHQLLRVVEVDLRDDGLPAADLAPALWGLLKDDITAHLRQDGLPVPETLTAAGLPQTGKCEQEYQNVLKNAPSVSIIVATHNRTDSLAETLITLLELDYPNYDIIVVDNAPSNSDTENFIKTTYGSSSKVRYVCEPRAGLGRAHNRGVEETQAEIVAFADDDILADKGWLTWLVAGFAVSPDVGCVTGMIIPYELETPAQIWIEQYGGFGKGYARRIFDMKENRPANPMYPYAAGTFGSGANMAFRTNPLRKIGGFDNALGAGTLAMGGDDLDSFFRVVRAGFKLVYEPRSYLYHKHRREYAGLCRQAYGYGVGLTAYLMKCLIDRPISIIDFIIKSPYSLAHIFSPKSGKNYKKQEGYPSELTTMERRGMLYGPIAYLRSRIASR